MVLFATFLAVEFLRHRRTYQSDMWSEEALLEERIESGTLPTLTHVTDAEITAPLEQKKRYLPKAPVRRLPFLHKVFR